jgi:hypothetical protein
MMEAASTSETSVNFYKTTWRIIPEDSHLHIKSNYCKLFLWLSVFLEKFVTQLVTSPLS